MSMNADMLMRPGIGQNASCTVGDRLRSRPKGRSWPRELWFLIHTHVCTCTCTCTCAYPFFNVVLCFHMYLIPQYFVTIYDYWTASCVHVQQAVLALHIHVTHKSMS